MFQEFNDLANFASKAQEKIREIAKGLLQENLVKELEKLQKADMISVQPMIYVPCLSCSQLPQYYYQILVGEQVIAHIMHGRQNAVDVSCGEICTGCFNQICGKGCGLVCKAACGQCAKTCKCILQCLACKPLASCCRNLGNYVQYVQQFEDYENALEIRHTTTPLGWGFSEKDGLYIQRNEFAVGAFYETNPQTSSDSASEHQQRAVFAGAAGSSGVDPTAVQAITNKAGAALDLVNPTGIKVTEDPVYDDVQYCLACCQCQPVELYIQQQEWQQPLMQTYAIHYLQKYVGRYIYGYQYKQLCDMFCFCCVRPAFFGYLYRDDVYLLDNFDNLIYRFTMSPLTYYEAVKDQQKGEKYRLEIKDTNDQSVGHVIKRKVVACCGCKSYWTFDISFPKAITPVQKLLFSYLLPFLNEKYMNLWNPGDSHQIQDIKHDRQWAEMQKGTNTIILDRLVDRMSYKNVSEVELPKIIAEVTLANPSRKEGQAIRFNSYKCSPALQREYVRRKKIEAKAKILQEILEKQMQALENAKEFKQ